MGLATILATGLTRAGMDAEVSAIERGEREPGVHLAKRIAKVLGKSVEEVF